MALGDAAQPQEGQSNRVVLDAYGFIKGWLMGMAGRRDRLLDVP